MLSCEIYNVFQNTFRYRTPTVAASDLQDSIYCPYIILSSAISKCIILQL